MSRKVLSSCFVLVAFIMGIGPQRCLRAQWRRMDVRPAVAMDFLTAHAGLASFEDLAHTIVRIDGVGSEDGVFGAPSTVTDIVIQDTNVAWATTENSGLYKASNHWNSWTSVNHRNDLKLIGVTPGKLWIFSGALYHTTNGATLLPVNGIDSTDSVVTINYFDSQTLIAVSEQRNGSQAIYRSGDGGENWTRLAIPAMHGDQSIYIDRYRWIAYTGGESLRRSLDTGRTWTVIPAPQQFDFTSLDGQVVGVPDCSGVFYVTNGMHPDIIRSENQGATFTLTGSFPTSLTNIRKGWTFDRGSIFYWLDRVNVAVVTTDGIDSSVDYSVGLYTTAIADPIFDTLCDPSPKSFTLHLATSLCIRTRVDSLVLVQGKGGLIGKLSPFDLRDSANVTLRYTGKSAGEDSLILRMYFHASDGVNEESKDIAALAHNVSSPGILDVPDSLAFGSVRIDSSKQVILVLANAGCEGIIVDSIISTNASAFRVGKPSGTTISSQSSISVAVTFTPNRIGKIVESLEIGTSAGHKFVKLTATGAQFVDAVRNENEGRVALWPNPTADFLHVEPGYDRALGLSIFDLLGREVMSRVIRSNEAIDLRALPEGAYIAHVGDQTHATVVRFSIVR